MLGRVSLASWNEIFKREIENLKARLNFLNLWALRGGLSKCPI